MTVMDTARHPPTPPHPHTSVPVPINYFVLLCNIISLFPIPFQECHTGQEWQTSVKALLLQFCSLSVFQQLCHKLARSYAKWLVSHHWTYFFQKTRNEFLKWHSTSMISEITIAFLKVSMLLLLAPGAIYMRLTSTRSFPCIRMTLALPLCY